MSFRYLWVLVLFSGLEAASFSSSEPLSAQASSFSSQYLLPGEPIVLEKFTVSSPIADFSAAKKWGQIVFKRSGTYKIVWQGGAIFFPSWTLGFSLDGSVLFGSIYGSFGCDLEPEAFEGSVVLSINAGQTLCFVNASSYPIRLVKTESDSASFTVRLFWLR